jgi:hypothetical protein
MGWPQIFVRGAARPYQLCMAMDRRHSMALRVATMLWQTTVNHRQQP